MRRARQRLHRLEGESLKHLKIPHIQTEVSVCYLYRKKALTPILAGSICGGLMLIIWIIGFAVYFRKRARRKERNRLIAAGKAQPREKDLEIPKERIVIPPDPAVLLGHRKPGEMVFPERQNSGNRPVVCSRNKSHSRSKPSGDDSAPLQETPSTIRTPEETVDQADSIEEEVIVPSGGR